MENGMRRYAWLSLLLLAGCGDDSLTRNFSTSRDSAPETIGATQMPLSAPPSLTMRPTRPGALPRNVGEVQPDQSAGSNGQNALVDAAGPPAEANIRTVINENSGMAYPGPGMVDRLMNWTPPAGYAPVSPNSAT